jgi:glycosyltransferase involved in cell wall biosynthesis
MKLVVMIPSYNEEETIASVIREIPRSIPGVDTVEVLVINDGSTDRTVEEARRAGADTVISFKKNKGLAPGFRAGLETALSMGADIIVNTDADGQYDGTEIPKLIRPILDNKADFVLGSRTKGTIEEMPLQKTIGNRMATWVTRQVSGLPVSDGQSGFRAFTRDAAMRLNVMSDYTYVQETLIQAANLGLVYTEVPILFRKRTGGSSRLISNIFNYAKRAGLTILRSYRDYQPLRTFLVIGLVLVVLGTIVGLRPLLYYLSTWTLAYFGSAILSILLLIVGFNVIALGLIADMLKTQRKIQDELLYRLKLVESR